MLNLGNLIDRIKTKDPLTAEVIQQTIDGLNNLARNVANDSNQTVATPPQLEAISVKANGGLVHVVLTHNAPIQKGINYFTEYDTSPSFPKPHVADMGASRSHFISLPAKNDDGDAQSWYFRSFAQYPGSKATRPLVFGGTVATPVDVGGSVNLTPIPSTGSGTASGNGQQGGYGLGRFLLRPKVT